MRRFFSVICITLFSGLVTLSCNKNDTHVIFAVYITKAVDSLPCLASISYDDYGSEEHSKHDYRITGNWIIHKMCYYDTQVNLDATGLANVKNIKVEISAKGSSVAQDCSDSSCTASVRKDLYD